ncbi:RagB/SusD family nutrient uptake outer membrane protein [Chryseolinea lacunae]|uniref:RagB/SusD family nutrient uptake outer membrane protein n=1 Tax=Chryseolinea lacunae TaxID=2801331 RepID=A0ABS1L292_9BACT|nr:RagB/SusD family nutrient uptake outer membrane protein [Chryseolinea lacunae]MBL0745774.1 RagB/SusD family nutrient uptake outer membrane protein [Chryseolinea lacunae]
MKIIAIKRTIKVVLASALLVSVASCKLNEDQYVYSSIFKDNFYKTASDAEAAISAAYGPLGDMYGGPAAVLASDLSADQMYPRVVVSRNTLTLFTYDTNFTGQRTAGRQGESPYQIWLSCYDGIEKANWAIRGVPSASMDAARKQQIIGEAYFLRAFYHWTATKNFGNVIVKTAPSDNVQLAALPKSPMAVVYKQIYQDLDSAIAKLPVHTAGLPKGRPSKEAALALYAKAALYNSDWGTAVAKAEAVLSNSFLMLMPNVLDVYDASKEDIARVENIFAFESESTTSVTGSQSASSQQLTGLYGPPASNGPAYGVTTYGSCFVYQKFFDSFDPKDKRRNLLDTTYIDKKGNVVPQASITPVTKKGVLVKKYRDPVSISGYTPNVPIFRVADLYLIAAEAEARLNGATSKAYQYINRVRQRAGLDDLTEGLGKDAFVDAVIQERSWELFCEGDRWYDLTRTDKFLTVIPLAVNEIYPVRQPQARNKYFPIPLDELNANRSLEQNDPWK